jgi:hypothetical protein
MANQERWVFRHLRGLFTSLKKLRESELPYLTRYRLSRWPLPNPPELNDYPGLIFLQYTNLDDTTEVTAYWKSHEAAIGNSGLFQKSIEVNGIPLSEGYLRQIATPKRRWWKVVPVGQWLLYASSIIGAVAILQTYFAKTLEAPDINAEISGPKVLNFLPSDAISFTLAITNRSREVQSKVVIEKPIAIGENGKLFDFEDFQGTLRPGPIAPTAILPVPFVGDPLPVGRYKINIQVKAKTGLLPDWKRSTTTKMIKVWGPNPEVTILSISKLNNKSGVLFHSLLLVGAEVPRGLNCRAIIENHPDVSMKNSNLLGASPPVRNPDSSAEPGKEVSSFEFETPYKFNALQKYPFFITMKRGAKDIDWEAVKSDTEVLCVSRQN